MIMSIIIKIMHGNINKYINIYKLEYTKYLYKIILIKEITINNNFPFIIIAMMSMISIN